MLAEKYLKFLERDASVFVKVDLIKQDFVVVAVILNHLLMLGGLGGRINFISPGRLI